MDSLFAASFLIIPKCAGTQTSVTFIPFSSLFIDCLLPQTSLELTSGAFSAASATWLSEKNQICCTVPPSPSNFYTHAKIAVTSAWNTVASLPSGMLIRCLSLLPYISAPVHPPFSGESTPPCIFASIPQLGKELEKTIYWESSISRRPNVNKILRKKTVIHRFLSPDQFWS